MGVIPKKKVSKVPWAQGWGDYLLKMALATGGRFRYRARHANVGTPARGAKHNRPRNLQRYGKKRVVGQLG